ncbi:DoxX family protein [uncultured Corynebacterium sp.]|uniref:DoxX family protein n=1 Tax=uncultured Corynebacterium sp. TaxID=159447 RepID=UPI0026013B70|nr:DoxX family membrane protein [uncultured Corynebacterium sp.]
MIRKLARPMLASIFIADGVDTLMNQQDHVEGAREVTKRARTIVPAQYASFLPSNPRTVVQIAGGTKVAAGTLYALGKAPRLAATTLALVQVPTALARHSFWETQDPKERKARKSGFLTDVALLGGLFLATADTEGRPGLAWRAEHAGKKANKKVQAALPTKSEAEKRTEELKGTASEWLGKAQEVGGDLQVKAADSLHRAEDYVDDNKDDWKDSLQTFAEEARETLTGAAENARETLADVADTAAKETKKTRKQARKQAKKARKNLKQYA